MASGSVSATSMSVISQLGEAGLHVTLAGSTRQRPSAARRKAVEQDGGIVGGDRIYLPTHGRALGIGETVEGSRVEHQSEVGADPRLPKSRHVGVQDSHVDAGFLDPLASALQGLVDDVDARDLPAALCQWDPPDGAAAAEVERCSVRRLAPALLAPEQLGELLGERGMLCEGLPGVEAEAVEELVGNARDGFLEVRSRRLLLRHRPRSIP